MSEPTLPVLPYAGTSGHQDPDTSRARAATNDMDGTTAKWQRRVLVALAVAGERGLTALEARSVLHEDNPNRVSPSLTVLHKEGRVARLAEKRAKHLVYVLPGYVNGRELAPHGRRRTVSIAESIEAACVEAEGAVSEELDLWSTPPSVPVSVLRAIMNGED